MLPVPGKKSTYYSVCSL